MSSKQELTKYVGAIDQGTSSTRFMVFAANSNKLICYHQIAMKAILPRKGWVEHDPYIILADVRKCIDTVGEQLGNDIKYVVTIGLTNQRETTIVWDKISGKPLYNAIVWNDSRTSETVDQLLEKIPNKNVDQFKKLCGLPISTYFSALKLRWLLDNVPEVKQTADENRLYFGTVDTWLIWNLTGGVNGGIYVTDVTNASRTMLMNIETLNWDSTLLNFFEISPNMLPCIKSSSEIYGYLYDTCLKGLPISGCLGDQQAAVVGQNCFKQGQAKNTYGTGCFLLYNTGSNLIHSSHGLLTTVAYKLGPNEPVIYALEGSIAIAGACISWLKDNMELINNIEEIESIAASVNDTADVYIVPAFSGLFAPYWKKDARGVICGLTQYTKKAHIVRAVLEAICYQTRDILEAMHSDSGITLTKLQVDGGMTLNNLLMQLQADLTGIDVVRPSMTETTALGAAIAAANAEGVDLVKIKSDVVYENARDSFVPSISKQERDTRYSKWKMAVNRSFEWIV